MCPVGRTDQLIHLNTCVFVEISRSCNFCGSYYGIFLNPLLCFKIEGKDFILISVYCNTEVWNVSSDKLSGYIKAQAFSI